MLFSGKGGPLSMSEADLAALETQGRELVEAGKRIHQHLSHCEYSDIKTLYGFFDILKYVGIYDEVVNPKPITQPQAEMACHHEE